MAVPTYEQIMLPFLGHLSKDQVCSMSALIEQLAVEFELSPVERNELLPSGSQYKFDNRVGWARTYMKKAGLLISPERGKVQITERGKTVLNENPGEINSKFLRRFSEFVQFQERSVSSGVDGKEQLQGVITPEEQLEESYSELRSSLESDLLERIKSASPRFFEQLVVDLLLSMGYGGSRKDAGERLGRTGDGGIDGIIKEDKLGLDVIYIQAKRWENTVGRPDIQAFVGSLEGQKANRGIFISTSQFSSEAKAYVEEISKKVVLIDGAKLAKLMIEHNVGVSVSAKYELKKIDTDYFIEE